MIKKESLVTCSFWREKGTCRIRRDEETYAATKRHAPQRRVMRRDERRHDAINSYTTRQREVRRDEEVHDATKDGNM